MHAYLTPNETIRKTYGMSTITDDKESLFGSIMDGVLRQSSPIIINCMLPSRIACLIL